MATPGIDLQAQRERAARLRAELAAKDANPVAWSRERIASTQFSLGVALYHGFNDVQGAIAAWRASIEASPSIAALTNLGTVARSTGDSALQRKCAALKALLFPAAAGAEAPPPRVKPQLAIYAGDSAAFTGANVTARNVWGSEIAVVKLAEAFAAEGTYDVTVFCNCSGEEAPEGVAGVAYLHLSHYEAWSRAHPVDTLIVSRYTHFFLEFEPRARRVIAWLHDLAPHYLWAGQALPAMGAPFFANILPRLDRIVCLSPWHRDALIDWLAQRGVTADTVALASPRIDVVGDGLDPRNFPAEPVARVPGRFVFCSDPARGLSPLLAIFAAVRARVPECTLHIHWSHLSPEHAAEVARTPGATFLGKLPQAELARALAAAELMVYPNVMHETYCMTALEAQAAGCVVVCRDFSGLRTTVGDDSGIKLAGAAIDADWQARAVAAALDLLANRARLAAMSARAIAWARPQTWGQRVAQDWLPRVLHAPKDAAEH